MKSCVCLLALLRLAYAQDQPPGRGVNFYSCEKEAALGAQLTKEARRDTTPLDSPVVREYLERIGQRLAEQLPMACLAPFTFAVVTDDTLTHEPFALPGGFIFVPAGLILAAQSEAELAGMLAHAMAHIAERHGTRQATRSELVNTASVPLIYMGGGQSFAVQQGAALAIPLGLLDFRRQCELAADRAAVRAMAAAGYDPAALAAYIERTQTDQAPARFSPLPARDARIAALNQAAAELPRAGYSAPDGLAPIQDIVRRLTAPPPRPAPSLRKP
jgi:predicted Zn-dependent protease